MRSELSKNWAAVPRISDPPAGKGEDGVFFQTSRCKRFLHRAEMSLEEPGAAPFLCSCPHSSMHTLLGPAAGAGMPHRALWTGSPHPALGGPTIPTGEGSREQGSDSTCLEPPVREGAPQRLIYEECVNVVWEQLAPSY